MLHQVKKMLQIISLVDLVQDQVLESVKIYTTLYFDLGGRHNPECLA
jgi:hypothetical protein